MNDQTQSFSYLIEHTWFVIAGVFALLIIFTIMIYRLARHDVSHKYENLRKRLNTWWWIICIVIAALVIDYRISIILFGIISILALREYFSALKLNNKGGLIIYLCYSTVFFQYYFIYRRWYELFTIFIPVFVFLLLPTVLVLQGETKNFLASAAQKFLGVMLTVFFFSHLAYLRVLPFQGGELFGGGRFKCVFNWFN